MSPNLIVLTHGWTGSSVFAGLLSHAGYWLGHTIQLRPEPGATRREATRQIIEQEARAMERVIARAPEQWTTLFFPIWEDEEEA